MFGRRSAVDAGHRPRICFLAGPAMYGLLWPSEGESFGGAELQTFLLARGLAERGIFDVCFLTYLRDQDVTPLDWAECHPGERMIERGLPVLSRFENERRWMKAFRRTGADLFVQSGLGEVNAHLRLFQRLTGARVALRLASDVDLDGTFISDGRWRRLALDGLRHADVVFARNRWQQERLSERFGYHAPILRNGFPARDVAPAATKDTVLWVASCQELKQPRVFLDLVRAFPQQSFTMVMPKNDLGLWESIVTEASQLPNLRFVERIPLSEIQGEFDRAKVFVNTSTVEGFPNTFAQAAIGATPVLSLNVDPDEVLESEGFGRCAHGDQARLTADLGELLQDDRLRDRMGASAFDYARRNHHEADVVAVFERGLAEAIGFDPGRPVSTLACPAPERSERKAAG